MPDILSLRNLALNFLGITAAPKWKIKSGVYDLAEYRRPLQNNRDPLQQMVLRKSFTSVEGYTDKVNRLWEMGNYSGGVRLALDTLSVGTTRSSVLSAPALIPVMDILCRGVPLEDPEQEFHWTGFENKNNLLRDFFMATPAYAPLFPMTGIYMNENGRLTITVRDDSISSGLQEKAAAVFCIYYRVPKMELCYA